jgi:hypothetical protein
MVGCLNFFFYCYFKEYDDCLDSLYTSANLSLIPVPITERFTSFSLFHKFESPSKL